MSSWEAGVGKTELVLSLAERMAASDRRVLVLSIYPRHTGEVRRLQEEAGRLGYDAAVLRDGGQLMSGLELLDGYDAVLGDTPAIGAGAEQSRSRRDRNRSRESYSRLGYLE